MMEYINYIQFNIWYNRKGYQFISDIKISLNNDDCKNYENKHYKKINIDLGRLGLNNGIFILLIDAYIWVKYYGRSLPEYSADTTIDYLNNELSTINVIKKVF